MSKRKDKVFSISMVESEVKEVDDYILQLNEQFGFSISRNELIRRATLAHLKFTKEDNADYSEIFKKVGKK